MDSAVPLPPPGETHTTTTTTTTTKVKTVRTQSQRRHENSFSTVPKVVPPFYTHSPRLCSWEVGYNFTPKIHRYRGVQGVVHHAWTKADTTPVEQDVVAAPPPLAKAAVAPRRQGCRPQSSRPPWNKAAHVRQSSTRTTSAASRSTSRGSRASARADKKTDEAAAQALVAPTRARYARPGPPKHAPEAPTIAGAGPRKPQRPTSAAPKSAWTSRTRAWGARTAATASATGETEKTAANPPAAPPARAHAPGPYHATASAFVPVPPTATSATQEEVVDKPHHSTPAVRPAPPASRYKPRTSAAYTLPPDYAMQSWALEQGQAPDVVICGSARHRWGDPAKPNTIYLNRHQHQDTRHALLHAYSAEARRYREDRYRKALAHTAELDHFLGDGDSAATAAVAHNYNFAAGADLFEDNAEACAADFYAKEARMRADLIAGVAQLSQVLPASRTTAEGASTITAVLDDGHACSPILLHTDNGVLPMAASEISGGAGPYDGTAVLARPCAPRELPATWQELRAAEASRVLPKGREWDRQHAIQLAVGATTQEAIIDLLIDPRYRRPGEFLRQRAKGGCRTAHPFAV